MLVTYLVLTVMLISDLLKKSFHDYRNATHVPSSRLQYFNSCCCGCCFSQFSSSMSLNRLDAHSKADCTNLISNHCYTYLSSYTVDDVQTIFQISDCTISSSLIADLLEWLLQHLGNFCALLFQSIVLVSHCVASPCIVILLTTSILGQSIHTIFQKEIFLRYVACEIGLLIQLLVC